MVFLKNLSFGITYNGEGRRQGPEVQYNCSSTSDVMATQTGGLRPERNG